MNRKIGEMSWPAPCELMDAVEWALRYSRSPDVSMEVRLSAASIIAAYKQMIFDTKQKRQMVISELRKGPNKPETHQSRRGKE